MRGDTCIFGVDMGRDTGVSGADDELDRCGVESESDEAVGDVKSEETYV